MNITMRKMIPADKDTVISMMQDFYASPAVSTNGSLEIFNSDFDACVNDSPYLEGYVFEHCSDTVGYAMLAKSFSTEFGRPCIWIEDLYLLFEYRGLGIGSSFFKYIEELYPKSILRLEVEEENKRAVHVYKKAGFDTLPYMEMKKLLD